MAQLIIEGTPLATFETEYLASWNDAIAAANQRPRRVKSHAQARFMFTQFQREWREFGYNLARDFLDDMWWLTFERPYLISTRAMVVVKVMRATQRTYDVHNAYCKAVFDGFSEAGIWKDDSWKYVPWVLYGWVHMDEIEMALRGGKNAFVIEVYELESVTLNNVVQVLPTFTEMLYEQQRG